MRRRRNMKKTQECEIRKSD